MTQKQKLKQKLKTQTTDIEEAEDTSTVDLLGFAVEVYGPGLEVSSGQPLIIMPWKPDKVELEDGD